MKNLSKIYLVPVLLLGLFLVGCSNNVSPDNQNETKKGETKTQEQSVEVEEGAATELKEKVVDLEKNNIYKNTNFGFQVDVPLGYEVVLVSSREAKADMNIPGEDRLEVRNSTGEVFAHILAPAPEIGWEAWDWENAESKNIPIGDSGEYIYQKKASPKSGYAQSQSVVVASWGYEFYQKMPNDIDYAKTGLVYMFFEDGDAASLDKFENMVSSFRFL